MVSWCLTVVYHRVEGGGGDIPKNNGPIGESGLTGWVPDTRSSYTPTAKHL